MPLTAQKAKSAEEQAADEGNSDAAKSVRGLGDTLGMTRGSSAAASQAARLPAADDSDTSGFVHTPRRREQDDEHANDEWRSQLGSLLSPFKTPGSKGGGAAPPPSTSMRSPGMLVYASRLAPGSMAHSPAMHGSGAFAASAGGSPSDPSSLHPDAVAGFTADGSPGGGGPGPSEAERQAVAKGDQAFQSLRLSSTATLVQLVQRPEMRHKIASSNAPRTLFATWRTVMAEAAAANEGGPGSKRKAVSSDASAIRHNAAVVLCYTFLSEHIPHDDMLLPIMSLCAAGMDAASAVAASAKTPHTVAASSRLSDLPDVAEHVSGAATTTSTPLLMTPEQLRTAAVCVLARRLLQPAETRPLDVLYVPGMIAAITAVARHKSTEAATLRVCAVALHRMLVVCQEQEQEGDDDDDAHASGAPGTTSSRSTNTEGVSQTDRARLVSRIAAGSVSGNDSFRVGSGTTPGTGNTQWGSRRRRRRDANAAVKVAVQNGIVPLLIRLIDMSTSGRLARSKAAVVRRAMASRSRPAQDAARADQAVNSRVTRGKQEHKGSGDDSSSDSSSVSSIGQDALAVGVSPAVGPGGRVPALVGGAFESHASLGTAEIAALNPEERTLLRDCASIQASCSSALAEIASVPSSVKSLGASRLLPALVALLSEYDVLPGTQDIAAGVLFRLTLGDDVLAREVLALPDAVRAIVAASCNRAQYVSQRCESLASWPEEEKAAGGAGPAGEEQAKQALRSRRSQAVAELSVDVLAAQSNGAAGLGDVLAEVQLSTIDGVPGVRIPQQTEEQPTGQSHLVHFASQSSRTLLHLAQHAPLVPTLIAEGAGDALRIWFEVGLTDIKTVAMNALATLFELSSAGSQRHLLRLGFVRTLVNTVHEYAEIQTEAQAAAAAEKEKAAARQRTGGAMPSRHSFSTRAGGSNSSLRGSLPSALPGSTKAAAAGKARGLPRRGVGIRGGSSVAPAGGLQSTGLPIGRCAKALRSLCAGSRDTVLHVLDHGAVSALASLLKHGDATARFDALQSLLSLTAHPQGVAAIAEPAAAAPRGKAAGEGEDWGLDGAVQVEDEEEEEDAQAQNDPLALLLHCARPTAPYKDVEPAVRTLSSICRSPKVRTRLVALTGDPLKLPPAVVDRLWGCISAFIQSARPHTPAGSVGAAGLRRTPSFAATGGVSVAPRDESSRENALAQLQEEEPMEGHKGQDAAVRTASTASAGGTAPAAVGGAQQEADTSAAESLRQRTESALRSGIMPSNNMHNLSRLLSPTDYSRSAIQAFAGGRDSAAAATQAQASLQSNASTSLAEGRGGSPEAGTARPQGSPAAYRRPASPEVADSPEAGEQQVMSHVSTTIAGGTSPTPILPSGAAPPSLTKPTARGLDRDLTSGSVDFSVPESTSAVPVGRKRRKESSAGLGTGAVADSSANSPAEEGWVEQARAWWAEHRLEGAIETLSRVARSRPLLKGVCISALCQLSAVPSCHQELIRHGVLPMLAAHARAVDSALRRECAQAAFNLTCTSHAQATPEHGAEVAAVERLVAQLERRGEAILLKHAEATVGVAPAAAAPDAGDTSRSSGSRGRGGKTVLATTAKERSAVALSRVFPTHPSLQQHLLGLAQQAALDSGAASASSFATRETQMVSSQIGSAMTVGALFRSDDWHTKHLTTAALFNLAVDPAARPYLLQGGMLWATVKLAVEAEAATQLTLASSIENCALRARLLPSGYLPPDVNKRGKVSAEEDDLLGGGGDAPDSGAPMWNLRSWEEASAMMVAKHQQERGGGLHVRSATQRKRRPRGLPRRAGAPVARGSARAALGSDKGSSAANLLGNAGEGPMFYVVLCADSESPWPGLDGSLRGQQHFTHLGEELPDLQELCTTRGGDPSLGILGDVAYDADEGEELSSDMLVGLGAGGHGREASTRSVSHVPETTVRPGSAGSASSQTDEGRTHAPADASARTGTSAGARQGAAAAGKHAYTDLCITPHTQAARFAAAGFEFACRGAGVLHAATKVLTGDSGEDATAKGDVGLPDADQCVRYDGAANCAAVMLRAPAMGDAASQLTASTLLANLVADATVGALLLGTLHEEPPAPDASGGIAMPATDAGAAGNALLAQAEDSDGSPRPASSETGAGGRPPMPPSGASAAAKIAAAAATATQAFLSVLGDRRTMDALTTLASAVHPRVRGNVARTLLGLTQHTGLHFSLVQKGILPALSECVANADLAGVTRCCVALARLISSPSARDSIAASPLTAIHLFVGITSRLRQLCSITRVPAWQAEGKVTPSALLARAQIALSVALHGMACAPHSSITGLLAAGWLRVLLAAGLLLCQTQPTPTRGAGAALRSAATIPTNDSNVWIMQTLPSSSKKASAPVATSGLCLDTWAVVAHAMSACLQHTFMQPGEEVCAALGASIALTQQLFYLSFIFVLGGRVPSILSSYALAGGVGGGGESSPGDAGQMDRSPAAVATPTHWFIVGGPGTDGGTHALHASVEPCKVALVRDSLPRMLQAWSAVTADSSVSQHLLKPAVLSTLAALMLPDHPCDCLLAELDSSPSTSARTDSSGAGETNEVAFFAGLPSKFWGGMPLSVSAPQCSLGQSASSGLGKVLAPATAAYVNCEVHADLNPLLQSGGNGLLVEDTPAGVGSSAQVVPVALLWAPTLATRVLCSILKTQSRSIVHGATLPPGVLACMMHSWQLSSENWTGVGPWLASKLPSGQETGHGSATTPTPKKQPLSVLPVELGRFVTAAARTCLLGCMQQLCSDASALGGGPSEAPPADDSSPMCTGAAQGGDASSLLATMAAAGLLEAACGTLQRIPEARRQLQGAYARLLALRSEDVEWTTTPTGEWVQLGASEMGAGEDVVNTVGGNATQPPAAQLRLAKALVQSSFTPPGGLSNSTMRGSAGGLYVTAASHVLPLALRKCFSAKSSAMARSLPAAVARPAFLYAPLHMCSAAAEGHSELPMGAPEAYYGGDTAQTRGTSASDRSAGCSSGKWSASSALRGGAGAGMGWLGDEDSRPRTAAIAGWFPWLQRQSVTVGAPWGQDALVLGGRGGIADDDNEVMKRVQSFLSLKPPAGAAPSTVHASVDAMPLPEVPMPGLGSPTHASSVGGTDETDDLVGVAPALIPIIREMGIAGHVNATRLAEALDCADRISMGMAALAQAEAACAQMLLAYSRVGGELTQALCKSAPGLWLLHRCGVSTGGTFAQVWGAEAPGAASGDALLSALFCSQAGLRIAGAFTLGCEGSTRTALQTDPLAARAAATAAAAAGTASAEGGNGDVGRKTSKSTTHASVMRKQLLLAQRCSAVLLPRLASRHVGTARAASEALATLAGCGEHARAVLLIDRCVPALASLTGGHGDGVDGTVRQHAATALQRMSASGSMQRQQAGDADDIVASVLLLLPDPLEDQHASADGEGGGPSSALSEGGASAGGLSADGRRGPVPVQLANVAEESGADSDADSEDGLLSGAAAPTSTPHGRPAHEATPSHSGGRHSDSSPSDEEDTALQVGATQVVEEGNDSDSNSTSSGAGGAPGHTAGAMPSSKSAAAAAAAYAAGGGNSKPITPQQRQRGAAVPVASGVFHSADAGPTLESWAHGGREGSTVPESNAQAIRVVAGADLFMNAADRLLVASFALAEFVVAATTQLPSSVVALPLWSPLPSPPAYLLGVESLVLESATGAYIPLLSSGSVAGLVPEDTPSVLLPAPSKSWLGALAPLRVGAWMQHTWQKMLTLQTTESSTGRGEGAPFSVNLFGELVAARTSMAPGAGATLRTDMWGEEEDARDMVQGSFGGLFDSSMDEQSVGFASEGGAVDSLMSGLRGGGTDLAAAFAGEDTHVSSNGVPKGLSRARLFLPPGEDPMASPLLGLNPPPAPEAGEGDDPTAPPPTLAHAVARQRDLSQAFNSLPAALRPAYAPVVMIGQQPTGAKASGNAREALMQAATYMRDALADDAAAHPHWRAYKLPGQDLSHATPEEVATAASMAAQRTLGSEVVRRASNRLGLGSLLHNQARQMPTETGTHAAAVDFAAAREEGSPRPGADADMLLLLGSSAAGGSIAQGLRTASASGRRSGTSGAPDAPPTSSQAKRKAHAGDTAVFTLGGEVGVRSHAAASDNGSASDAPKPWWERQHARNRKAGGQMGGDAMQAGGTPGGKVPLPALSPRGSVRSGGEGGEASAKGGADGPTGPDVYARLSQDSKMRASATQKPGESPSLRKSAPLGPITRAPKPVVVHSRPKAGAPAASKGPPVRETAADSREDKKCPTKSKAQSLLARMEANALATRGNTTRRVVAGGTALKAYSAMAEVKPGKLRGAMPLPSPVKIKRKAKGGKKPGKGAAAGGAARAPGPPTAVQRGGTSDPSQRTAVSAAAPENSTHGPPGDAALPARKTVSAKTASPGAQALSLPGGPGVQAPPRSPDADHAGSDAVVEHTGEVEAQAQVKVPYTSQHK